MPVFAYRRNDVPRHAEGHGRAFLRAFTWFAGLALLAVFAAIGQAQRDGAPFGIDAVYLDTDPAATKKLAAARDLLAARQWDDGIDLIRQIGEQHGERLTSIAAGRYVSVQAYCDILLSSLPEEGLALYRSKVDPNARRWFEAARETRDEEGLQRIVHRAYLSSYGDDALLLLGQLAWEAGELSRARSYWEQLLPAEPGPEPGQLPVVLRYPNSEIAAAQVRARLVLCSLLQGQLSRGRRELAAFAKLHPKESGFLAGRTGVLVDLLAEQAAIAEKAVFPPTAGATQTFAGNPQRNSVQPNAIDVGSIQWTVPLPVVKQERDLPNDDPFDRPVLFDRPNRGPKPLSQAVLGCYPVVSDNLVFYCDETSIYAHELLSGAGGRPAWGDDPVIYRLPPELLRQVQPSRRQAGVPRFTLSIEKSRLYARLGSSSPHGRNRVASAPVSVLVCLDLERQGDLRFSLRADEVAADGGPWVFDGAPLVAQGKLYVALRRSEPQLQLNVACFDAETAKLLWNRKVCLGLEAFGPEVDEVHHQLLSLADERLYYGTNLGAVAAIDARDGTLQWVSSYPRAYVESIAAFNRRQQQGPNPCVCYDGLVFAAPTDSDRILAYDAETGILQWDRELRGNSHQLVGVDNGRLIVAGELLWALDADDGKIHWVTGQTDPATSTRGRAAIAGGMVYWPRREEIVMVEISSGATRREIDLRQQHGLSGGGNITLADGMLLLAQTDKLVAFSEFGSLRKERHDQVTMNPDSARAHYDLALVADAMREPDVALAELAKARELLQPLRERSGEPLDSLISRQLVRLLGRIDSGALSASRAKAAVLAWQSMLDLPPPWVTGSSEREPIAVRARREIDRLVAAQGDHAYAPVEHTAGKEWMAALERRDFNRTQELLRRFPNAAATRSVAMQMAAQMRAAGQSHSADAVYRTLLDDQPDLRAAALAGLAQGAEQRAAWDSALGWWRRLYDQEAGARVVVDGMPRVVHEFVPARITEIESRETGNPVAPRSPMPFRRTWNRELPSGSATWLPEGAPPSRSARGLVIASDTVRFVDFESGRTRWETSLAEPLRWSGYAGGVLVLGTASTATGVAPLDGTIVWHRSFRDRDTGPLDFRTAGDRLCLLSGSRELISLEPASGELRWRHLPSRETIQPHWHCGTERHVLQVLAPDRIQVLDARNGMLIAEQPGSSERWAQDPVALDSDRLLGILDGPQPPAVFDSVSSQIQCSYRGPISTSMSTPRLAASGSTLVAVIDGSALVRIDPTTGQKLWSCRAGVSLVTNPEFSIAIDDERLYVASSGILRGIALDSGRMLWEQYVGPAVDDWQVERVGGWIAAHPRTASKQFAVVLCDPDSGVVVQRLLGEGPTRSIRLQASPGRLVLATDRRVTGFRPLASSSL